MHSITPSKRQRVDEGEDEGRGEGGGEGGREGRGARPARAPAGAVRSGGHPGCRPLPPKAKEEQGHPGGQGPIDSALP